MEGQARSTADPLQLDQRRAAIAAQAGSVREGLRWGHLLTLMPALIVMTVCGAGLAGAFWGHAARELDSSPHHLRHALAALVAGYVVAALLAAWAWAGFDVRRAARRLPLVLAFGAVGILVLLASSLVHIGGAAGGGSPGGGSSTEASKPPSAPSTLATTLVNPEEAAAVLGAEVGEPDVQGASFVRGGSICRYRALDRSATLTVIVREAPRGSSADRLLQRGEPLPDLGGRAVMIRSGVFVLSGRWLLSLSVRRRDRGATDQSALIEGARRAVALLAHAAEAAGA